MDLELQYPFNSWKGKNTQVKGNQYIKKQKTTLLSWRLQFSDQQRHRGTLKRKRPIPDRAWSIISRRKKAIIWNLEQTKPDYPQRKNN